MDEQLKNSVEAEESAQTAEWDSEADGLAYGAEEYSSESSSVDSEQTGVKLSGDGELEFSDEFLGYQDKPEYGAEQEAEPQYYTTDELRQIPFEEWDEKRLRGDIREFLPIYREQIQRRQLETQLAQRPQTPPMFSEPQPYTAQELADEAQKLACEKLGLEDPDDFDVYEGEHQAALNLAMQELSNKRSAEVANYQRVASGYRELQDFTGKLMRQSDYMEFDKWFSNKMRESGVTYDQVNAGLARYIQDSGGDFRGVQRVITNWYQEFRNTGTNAPKPQARNRPPVLERSGMNNEVGQRTINFNRFGELDEDGQAHALIKLGLV